MIHYRPYTSFIVAPPMSPYIDVMGKTMPDVVTHRIDVASDISHYMDPETPADELAEIYYLPNKMAEGRNISHSSSDVLRMEARITRTIGFPFDSIRRAIAGNPNAPVPLLADAALSFPREVANNPALPFMLITDPTLRQFPTRAIQQILPYANASIMNALVTILDQRAKDNPPTQLDWKQLLQEEY